MRFFFCKVSKRYKTKTRINIEMDYSKGKIYKIIDESNGDLYIGSTCQELKHRFQTHHLFYGREKYNKIKSNCKISLIEEYPCNNKRELEEREQYWMDKIDCINLTRAFREIEFHKEDARKRASKYYIENKDKCNEIKKKNHHKRMKEQSYRDKKNKREYERREWENSMGGRKDHNNNSLVKIDPDLFL